MLASVTVPAMALDEVDESGATTLGDPDSDGVVVVDVVDCVGTVVEVLVEVESDFDLVVEVGLGVVVEDGALGVVVEVEESGGVVVGDDVLELDLTVVGVVVDACAGFVVEVVLPSVDEDPLPPGTVELVVVCT